MRFNPPRWIASLIIAALPTTLALAETDADWRIGLARTTITPMKPVPLAGYASRQGSFEKVDQDLHAKALALEDAQGGRALLITCDLLGLHRNVTEAICQRIMQRTGLPREAILINFSHTHTGPIVALNPPKSERYSTAEAKAIATYGQWFADRIVEIALAALEQRKPALLSFGAGQVRFPVNRREHTANGVILGFNPNGPTDRSVPVLLISSPDGSPLGIVFGAACHNTCLGPQHNFISGDYAGYAQSLLEKAVGGVQAMFVQGCGGDSSPYPTGSLAHARTHGAELVTEVGRVLTKENLRTLRGPLRTRLDRVDLPLEEAPSLDQINAMAKDRAAWRRQAAAQLLALHRSGDLKTTHYRAPLALWQFGRDLTFIGLPGEPVADYVSAIKQALGPSDLWIAGYSNDHFGYLTNPRILAEGGYEANRGLSNGRRFAPEVEKTVIDKLRELAAAAGRPLPSQE